MVEAGLAPALGMASDLERTRELELLDIHLMGWDASRPVPVRRLLREWLIFAPLMGAAIWLLQRDDAAVTGSLVGLLASLPLYLGFGFVLAKFGYQRRTLAELRTPRATPTSSAAPTAEPRPRPAPTRRTSTAPSRRTPKRR